MRHAVRKPADTKPQITHPSAPLTSQPGSAGGMEFRSRPSLFTSPDKERASRAKHVNKSNLVSKFSEFTTSTVQSVQTVVRPMSVAKAPAAPSSDAPPQPVAPARRAQPADAMLKKGLARADAHEQPAYKKPKLRSRAARKLGTSTKVVSIGAAAFAFLLLGAFFAYQNVPNFAMRVAATRSGVHASMPGYQPAGFAVRGPIHYSSGEVTISFNANADAARKFTITQKNSTWNSDALLNNYVASAGKMYQTYQDQGRTIYIYNGSNATWVNEGVWYNIAGNSSLNGEQLVRIATSM